LIVHVLIGIEDRFGLQVFLLQSSERRDVFYLSVDLLMIDYKP